MHGQLFTCEERTTTMAKVVLGKRPESFKKTVEFTMLDGTKGAIEVDYVYRTRTEFGALVDSMNADAKEKQDALASKPADGPAADQPVPVFSLEKHTAQGIEANADYILKIAKGWNLDFEFTRANIIKLGDEEPAGFHALMDDYRQAIDQGRRGNW